MLKRKSITTTGAAVMYAGTSEKYFANMCLKGKRLRKLYGERIPPKDAASALFATKVGGQWWIPLDELNRVFNV